MDTVKINAVESTSKTAAKAVKKAALILFTATVGFFLSDISFESDISPFAAAFAAGSQGVYLIPAGIGAAVGAFVFCRPVNTLKYVGAILLIMLFRVASARLLKKSKEIYLFPAISFVCVFLSSAAVMFTQLPDVESIFLALCEALIAGAATAFWHRVFVLLPDRGNLFAASAGDATSFIFSGTLLLLSFSKYSIGDFSPARTVCFLLIMLFSLCAGESAGAVTGICSGLVLGFSGEQPHLIFALPAAGVLCGILKDLGKIAVASGFLVCDTLFLVLKGDASTAFAAMIEAAAASVVITVLPAAFYSRAGERLRPFSKETYSDENKALLKLRIGKIAGAVSDISDAVGAVCRLLSGDEKTDALEIGRGVRTEVCGACAKNGYCWNTSAPLTKKAFAEACGTVIKNGGIYPETAPQRIALTCRSLETVCDAFNGKYKEYSAQLSAKSEVFDVKESAAGQFKTLSGLMLSAADGICSASESEPYIKSLIKGVFDSAGFNYSSLLVYSDNNSRYVAELTCPKKPEDADYNMILEKLYTKTNVKFSAPVFSDIAPSGTAVTFCEMPPLRVQFFKCSSPGSGEKYCGDACEGFADACGNFYCVLSDGMGTGTEAAVNSAMTCSLISRLLRAGFDTDSAVSAVNSALLVNASEEMLATADVCKVDLFSGNVWFFKAGAAISVLKKGPKTAIIEKSSLPLGIMKESKFEITETSLEAGDVIIMMSDGADQIPKQFYKDLFYQNRDAGAKELAGLVMSEAAKRAPIGRTDDITVACLMIKER